MRRKGVHSRGPGGSRYELGASGYSFTPAESAVIVPDTAVGIVAQGVTQAGTVTQWDAIWGGRAALVSLGSIGAANDPTWNATGGPGGGPAVVFDGVNDALRDAVMGLWGFGPSGFDLDVWGFCAGAETAGDILLRWVGGDQVTLGVTGAPVLRCPTAGVGGATALGTTVVTGTCRRMQFRGAAGGLQDAVVNGVVEQSVANTHAAWTDGGSLALGGSTAGSTPTALTCVAWAITLGSAAAQPLSALQDAYLAALVKNYVPGLV